jgi:hypothetical protein
MKGKTYLMALVNGRHRAAMSERATWQACSHESGVDWGQSGREDAD